MNASKLTLIVTTAALMTACSATPERVAELDEARVLVEQADNDPRAQQAAAEHLARAREALNDAERALVDDKDTDLVRHRAHLAGQHAKIALEEAGEQAARERIEAAELERKEVLLQARTREAERAEEVAQRRTAQAQFARGEAQMAMARAERLQDELSDLKARQTERGLVLTLGDVLFDTDKASLKPGAEQTVARLAEFLDTHPDRRLLIEGHTDSRGPEQYNEVLSGKRADAVRSALERHGIEAARIRIAALGEAYPVTSNDTVAGRQQNRRVEVVISDADGGFPQSAMRSLAHNDGD